jgi:hypothetical protein
LFSKLDRSFYPGGASARIAVIFLMPSWGDLGLELAPSWNMLNAGAITIHLYPLHLNGIYQLRLPGQNTALVFRLGGGINLMRGTNSQSSGSFFTWIPSAAVGAAFRWFIQGTQNFRRTASGTFYLEVGAEYTHVFSVDSPQLDYIRPSIGAGWRF